MSINYWGVVPAAGVGKRMGADRPKQYLELAGKTVIENTLERLLDIEIFAGIVVALSSDDEYWPELPLAANPKILIAPGGAERGDSVRSALDYLSNKALPDDWVLVHDAARCCVTVSDIDRLIDALKDDPVGGILALAVHDTVKAVEDGRVRNTLDRSLIWRALTPQMFKYEALKNALEKANGRGQRVTDEASAMELTGAAPRIVEGRADNLKITQAEDIPLASFYLARQRDEAMHRAVR